ncbi:MAG: hypothetical protein FJ100_17010 [Deltaproteobacteria bacterium]|nr:hypothetical protein [Deltaproteobacteria bacterium]
MAPSPARNIDPTLGLGSKAERRKRPPAIIGGCGAACATPEAAVRFLVDQMQTTHRMEALRSVFDWSLLTVDGKDLGNGWADLWAEPSRHRERAAQIDAWIANWSRWADRVTEPQDWARMASTGIRVRLDPHNPQRAVVQVQHPPLGPAGGAAVWRWVFGLRGDEWLVVAIDHAPGLEAP